MADLFKANIPAPNSPIASADVRNNFAALYEKVQPLEPRVSSANPYGITIAGGPVYFRTSGATSLNFLNFQTTEIDLSTSSNGYTTTKTSFNTVSGRQKRDSNGISKFTAANLIREILISLAPDGKLIFTEGATTPTGLSRPFDIYFKDGEIPICFVLVRQAGDTSKAGQLQRIQQIDITDIRPFVTIAFEGYAEANDAGLNASVRLSKIETNTARSSNALAVTIPRTALLSNDPNTELQISAGRAVFEGYNAHFPGAIIDLSYQDGDGYYFPGGSRADGSDYDLTSVLFNKVVICLQRNKATGAVIPFAYHGIPASVISAIQLNSSIYINESFKLDTTTFSILPLAVVLYKFDSTHSSKLYSLKEVGGKVYNQTGSTSFRINFDIDVQLVATNSNATNTFNIDLTHIASEDPDIDISAWITTNLIQQQVELYDDISVPFRRTVMSCTAISSTVSNALYKVVVDRAFIQSAGTKIDLENVDISSNRKPQMRVLKAHTSLIEDVRAFVGS